MKYAEAAAIIDLVDNTKTAAKPRTLETLVQKGWAKIVDGRYEATPSGVVAMMAYSVKLARQRTG